MFTWDIIGQLAWTGIASSTYYCLFAIAFALMLKVNRVWNFAQAGMMVVAYFAMFVSFRLLGLHPALGILIGAAATIAVSLAIEWFGFRVLRTRNSSVLTYFIFTIVLSQFAIYTAELIFGPDPKTLFASIMSPVFLVGPIVVSHWDLQALAATAVLVIGLAAFLRFTKDGQFLFAVADNPELAEIYGISSARAYAIAMLIAAIFVVAGMYLVGVRAAMFPATPLNQFLIFAVIATLLAGIGNVFAAGVAAVALSLLQSFSILVISSTWQILLIYIVLFITILLFPAGVVLPGSSRKIQRAAARDIPLAVPAAAPDRRKADGRP
jgi:branched-subunit amino acid ABC-type transport system permease component